MKKIFKKNIYPFLNTKNVMRLLSNLERAFEKN